MKYFLHDTSAFEDEKISELFIQFGYEGLGLFYTTLEKLAKQEKPVKTSVLKHQLKVGKKLNKCWNFMESLGILSSNNGETFNKQLLNFSEKFQIKKEKNTKRISEWRKNQELAENVTCHEHICNTPKDNISKVKESKVNINKEEILEKIKISENLKTLNDLKIEFTGRKIEIEKSYYSLINYLINSELNIDHILILNQLISFENFCDLTKIAKEKGVLIKDKIDFIINTPEYLKNKKSLYLTIKGLLNFEKKQTHGQKSIKLNDPNQAIRDGGYGER